MRYLLSILLLSLAVSLSAQVKGNRQIVTETYDVQDITSIDIGLYADIEVDMSAPTSSITITGESNLLKLIGRDIEDGRLVLDQIKWIKPTKRVKISIGAPHLTFIQQGTHDDVIVKNANGSSLGVSALLGSITLSGAVDYLNAGGESGEIDARSLEADHVEINLWGPGKINLASPKKISGIVEEEGVVYYDDNDTKVTLKKRGDAELLERSTAALAPKIKRPEAKFIDFKLKNNSRKRINAYVRGPKPDGKYFSYGFPMRAGQVRKENWTVGTKVFKQTNLGIRKLLVEITADDEGEVVMLYADE